MKKKVIALLMFAVIGLMFAGCGGNEPTPHADVSVFLTSDGSEIDLVGTDLFEQVYVPYAKGENRTAFSDVKAFADSSGYEYSCVAPTAESAGEIKVLSGDDYVYFAFIERTSGIHTIMIVSYYQASSNSEVSLSNFSANGDHAYDKLTTHEIGESDKSVSTIAEQREFLFTAEKGALSAACGTVPSVDDSLVTDTSLGTQ